MNLLPDIIETVGRSKKGWSIPTKLYNDSSVITLFGEVDDELVYTIITQLLYLDSLDSEEPIKLYINSPGGSVYAGLAIIDTINSMTRKVDTIGMGICASMGSMILFCGTGRRRTLENCRIMIHSVISGTGGSIHDQIIDLKETEYLQDKLMRMISSYSNGKTSYEKIELMTQRDKYLSPEECVELGLIEDVV